MSNTKFHATFHQHSGEYVMSEMLILDAWVLFFLLIITDSVAVLRNACVPAVWTCGLFLL